MPILRALGSLVWVMMVAVGCADTSTTYDSSSQAVTATVTSISITPSASAIPAGVQQQLKATAIYSNHSKKALTSGVTWSVSDPSIASVNATGLVTALHPGVVTVSGQFAGTSGTATVTVTNATLTGLSVTPAKRVINIGVAFTFKAIGKFSDGTKFKLTSGVAWSSTNSSIATTDANGRVTGKNAGTVRVVASVGGFTDTAVVTVGTATLTSVAVTPATASLPIGVVETFVATGTYSDHTTMDLSDVATWTSSKPAIATVATDVPGLITAVAIGKSTITANVGGKKGTAVVTVKAVTLTSITVTPSIVSLPSGTTQQLQATGIYSDHTTRDLTAAVTWSSSSPAVGVSNATGSEGLATALAIGTATVSAIDVGTGLTGATTVGVTAAVLTAIDVTPANTSIALGYTQSYAAIGTFSDGTHRDLTSSITWSIAPATVASISDDADSAGLVTSLTIGTATITALDPTSQIAGTAGLVVSPATLSSLALTPPSATIANGFAQQFAAVGTYSDHSVADLTSVVTWSIPTGTATISNVPGSSGLASSDGVGTSTVSAIDPMSGKTASATLQVSAAVVVALTISPQSVALDIGQTQQFNALGTFSDHTTSDLTQDVTWLPSNSNASISNADGSHGLATGIAGGTATITAIDPATSVSATATVTIVDLCSGAPCENGGVCVSGTTSYTCTCAAGFGGANCEDQTLQLEGVVRDFHSTFPSFATLAQAPIAGILNAELDPLPWHSVVGAPRPQAEEQLWSNVPGLNAATPFSLTLSNHGQTNPNVFEFASTAFYPIDNQLFGNEGAAHNDYFTYEAHTTVTYTPGLVLKFNGGEPMWVFINGIWTFGPGSVHFDDAFWGLQPGNAYPLDIFFVHAGAPTSTIQIQLTRGPASPEVPLTPIPVAFDMLYGGASVLPSGELRLTPDSTPEIAGAAWVHVPAGGFRTDFYVEMASQTIIEQGVPEVFTTPAEGFALVFAPSPGLGGTGWSLGYEGLGPSIAFEFDTHQDAALGDSYRGQFGEFVEVSIHTLGAAQPNSASEQASIGKGLPLSELTSNCGPLCFGTHVWATFDPPASGEIYGWIRVYMDRGAFRYDGASGSPLIPVAQAQVVPDLLGTDGYVGLTSSTGDLSVSGWTDVLDWSLSTYTPPPADAEETVLVAPPGTTEAQHASHVTIQARERTGTDLHSGGASFQATLVSGATVIPETVVDNNDGTYVVSYTPTFAGTWFLYVRLQGVDIEGSPFVFTATP